MRLLAVVIACHACAPAAPVSVATPEPRAPVVRADPRRVLVEKTFAALAANDRKALMELADADDLVDRMLACSNPPDARRKGVAVRLHLAELAKRLGGQALEVIEVPAPGEHVTRTVRRRGEVVDRCEHKVPAEYQEVDVWVRSGKDELRMRVSIVKVEGRLYLHDAPRFVRLEGPADLGLIDQLEVLADRMCACPDAICAEQVMTDLQLWAHAKSKAAARNEIVEASPDSARRQADLQKRYMDCRKQVP